MNIQDLPFEELKKRILSRDNLIYDIELARRIAERKEPESTFFFEAYSIPFLQDIAIWIAHENSYRGVLGFYYDYVSSPLVTNEYGLRVPQFRLLRQYKANNQAHLYTYVMVCTQREARRYFGRKKPGSLIVGETKSFDFERAFLNKIDCEDETAFLHSDNEEIGWEILNAFFYEDVVNEEEHAKRIEKVKKAFDWLQEKDRLVLQLVVIEDKSGLDAFKQMKQYLSPKSRDNDVDKWDDKAKEDTISLWKTRALRHLEAIVRDPNLKI